MRAAKNLSPRVSLLTKSSREASPKIPQEEAASLTTGGVSLHLFPGSFTSPFAGKSESLPSSKVRTKPASFLTYQFGNRERKTCGAHTEEELENAQVPFSKGGRLVDIPGSLNLGVNTFLWLGFFSLFLNFHTGVVTAPPHGEVPGWGGGGQIPQAKSKTSNIRRKKPLKTTSGRKTHQKKEKKLKSSHKCTPGLRVCKTTTT